MSGATAVSSDSGKPNRKMESPSSGNSAKRRNPVSSSANLYTFQSMDEKDQDGSDASAKRRNLGMDEKNRDGEYPSGLEEAEPTEGSIVISDEMEANISQIMERVERFTQMVSEMLDSGKAMFKELSNEFEERLVAIHKQQIDQWQEEIKELRFIDASNEEINAVLLNASYLLHNPKGES